MQKLLTPVNFGSFSILHRVVVLAPPRLGRRMLASDVRRACPGGLIMQPFSPDMGLTKRSSTSRQPSIEAWRYLNGQVRERGGMSVAQVECTPMPTDPRQTEADIAIPASQNVATLALAAAFDGVELNLAKYVPAQTVTPVLEKIGAVIDVCSADRVGVLLAPFAWMVGPGDDRLVEPYCRLLAALYDLEIAYIHIAGTVTPDRGDLSASPLGRHLRNAFPGMLIASGAYTPQGAIDSVNSRWADAIGFSLVAGDGNSLLKAVNVAATPPRAPAKRIAGGLPD